VDFVLPASTGTVKVEKRYAGPSAWELR
jgi:hypothetical protein